MIYGPGDYVRRFHPVLKRIDDGRRFILLQETVAEWKSPRRYVANVAAAVALAAVDDRAAGRVYNVAERTGKFVVFPKDTTPAHLLFPGNAAQHWEADSLRIRQELEYREPVSIEEGIGRTIEWDRSYVPVSALPHPFDYAAEDAALRTKMSKI